MSTNAYTCELSQMILAWREAFNLPNIPFINIQLPGHNGGGVNPYQDNDEGFPAGDLFSAIQIAQNNVFKLINNTGLVTIMDLGQNTIHYNHKTPAAVRATLWTKYLTYNDLTVNPQPPRFNYAYKNHPNDLSVNIKISNVGPNGLQLNEAFHCFNWPANMIQIYTDKKVNISCCDMGGANVVRMRLEGIYVSLGKEHGKTALHPYIWNWVPANITKIINRPNGSDFSIIVAEPILPLPGCQNCGEFKTFNHTVSVSIRDIEINTMSTCSIGNVYNMSVSKGGPYPVVYDAINSLEY